MPGKQRPLVRVRDIDPRVVIGLRYAMGSNFTGRVLYASAEAWLRPGTAARLRRAQDLLEGLAPGVRFLVLDAYRPPAAQRALWAACPDERFVAPPGRGSRHTRGTAVDVTLVDAEGRELEMPSGYDEFTERAVRGWGGGTEAGRRHLEWLTRVMEGAGFQTIESEWWHYDDADWRECPLLDWEPGL